mmetsp:Transcript_19683/g.29391  ORF Transcript_19683/g.29391 Transcript_19683/m.29391 type:complete len:384 (-) Transcript_19683:102-1253(-)
MAASRLLFLTALAPLGQTIHTKTKHSLAEDSIHNNNLLKSNKSLLENKYLLKSNKSLTKNRNLLKTNESLVKSNSSMRLRSKQGVIPPIPPWEANPFDRGIVRAATCQGLIQQQCWWPCADGYSGNGGLCEDIKRECALTFCDPLCLEEHTWTCQVLFEKDIFRWAVWDHRYSDSICRQIIAYACVKILQCCNDDKYLETWVFDKALSHYWLDAFPVPACQHHNATDPEEIELTCNACKKGIQLILKPPEMTCDIRYFHELPHYPYSEAHYFGWTVPARKHFRVPFPLGKDDIHFSMYWRCKMLEPIAQGMLGAIKAAVQDSICNCIGCCGLPSRPESQAPSCYWYMWKSDFHHTHDYELQYNDLVDKEAKKHNTLQTWGLNG